MQEHARHGQYRHSYKILFDLVSHVLCLAVSHARGRAARTPCGADDTRVYFSISDDGRELWSARDLSQNHVTGLGVSGRLIAVGFHEKVWVWSTHGNENCSVIYIGLLPAALAALMHVHPLNCVACSSL